MKIIPAPTISLATEVNTYAEDIFVGYRYFETFAKDAVQFPFGFGLSYTTFALENIQVKTYGDTVRVKVARKEYRFLLRQGSGAGLRRCSPGCSGQGGSGAGSVSRRQSCSSPVRPRRLNLTFGLDALASFDDSGATGHKDAWVLEAGEYGIYVGTDVRSAQKQGAVEVPELRVVRQLQEVCAPVADALTVWSSENGEKAFEPVPMATRSLKDRILDNLPEEIPFTGDQGH